MPPRPHDADALRFSERLSLWLKQHNFNEALMLRPAPCIGLHCRLWRKEGLIAMSALANLAKIGHSSPCHDDDLGSFA